MAVDRMTVAEQTVISACRNFCSTESSLPVEIQYSETTKKNKQQNSKVLELESSTSQDGVMEVFQALFETCK